MNAEENGLMKRQLYYRLIALWVICEGFAGGIMHGLSIPFSGMLISGSAVICICLIGYYINGKPEKDNLPFGAGASKGEKPTVKGAILKATIIVCVFKMMLSPHTPPTAYIAVAFQGLVGQALFSYLRYFKLSCMILGVLALVESAMQRLLVVVLIYGNDFWIAMNDFIRKLLQIKTVTNYSWWLAIGYLLIHAVGGIIVGIIAGKIVTKSKSWKTGNEQYLINDIGENQEIAARPAKRRKGKMKTLFVIIWIILMLLFIQSVFKIGNPILPSGKLFLIFLRSVLIILAWYFIVGPIVTLWIRKRLERQGEQSKSDISRVVLLLPSTENIFRKSWEMSALKNGLSRLSLFWKIVLMNTLRDN